MAFKDTTPQFQMVELSRIDPDPGHIRQSVGEDTLKGLVNAIQKVGVIHPLILRTSSAGRFQVVVGERRRQAALQAGEDKVPALVCDCTEEEALEVRVFENIGLGVRAALEPREMATAIHTIAERFDSPDLAAQYFARSANWLAQATAAANLSEKVTALLDSGKIGSTSAAIQLEKLAKKNEAKAESLIEHIEQLPEGEKVSKKVVDEVLQKETGRGKKAAPAEAEDMVMAEAPMTEAAIQPPTPQTEAAPWEAPAEEVPAPVPAAAPARSRINPGKVKLVADLLGLSEEDEEELLARLIDEFLSMKGV